MTIDLSNLEELAGGSNEFIRDIIDIFLKETPPNLTLLREHAAASDFQQLEFLSHKMKSSIGLLGIAEAETAASNVEVLAKKGSLDGVDALIDTLESSCKSAMEELEAVLEKYQ